MATRTASSASRNSGFSGASSSSSTDPLAAIKFSHQAEKLSLLQQDSNGTNEGGAAVRAEWITPHDPIIVTADGGRLPGVPLEEAHKLNQLKEEVDGVNEDGIVFDNDAQYHEKGFDETRSSTPRGNASSSRQQRASIQKTAGGPLRRAMPPSHTHPLFPPLPLYGPPTFLRNVQCMTFRASSAVLSLAFLGVIVLGSAFTSIPLMFKHIWLRLNFHDPDDSRPFYLEEKRRQQARWEQQDLWHRKRARRNSETQCDDKEAEAGQNDGFIPTEGGPDPLICDIGYYARRVGLDIEEFKVQTEDGFIITLWHVYDPREFTPLSAAEREIRGPDVFTGAGPSSTSRTTSKKKKYPVLMIHGLLQSAGAYCTNDDDSLAFYLAKSGYDVWLGNNRCGFKPQHILLSYSDPRMWAWNIRQMGVMDLPAFISRVLSETGFPKLGLIAHSQGTTETFVALAKEQRPDLGSKISVFCALAPAAYAGPLIGKMYFKFMRIISPGFFRMMFGIHAFIPLMMTMHAYLPGQLYGAMGYRVFSFLFNWSDTRWDRGLRNRMFQFAPVYVSAESMRWWLGRECFAKHKCILQTREEGQIEDEEDGIYDGKKAVSKPLNTDRRNSSPDDIDGIELEERAARDMNQDENNHIGYVHDNSAHRHTPSGRKYKGSTAWYDDNCPPFALWVAGSDDLVDGRKLLRRFERGREPHVRVVHAKVIDEYEHLDVIWAIDSIEKVGREVKEVIWRTCESKEECRVPKGCEEREMGMEEGRGGPRREEIGSSSDVLDSEPVAQRRGLRKWTLARLLSR
jgi:pimeloyl-ACP methyl ester carboxylesterase